MALALKNGVPWLAPYRPLAEQVLHAANAASVVAALNAARGDTSASPRFVDHRELPAGEPYESFIARTACIPTRENLHDLLNGLVWLTYPQTKRWLNILQAREIASRGATGARGPLRDALTVFDENAVVLQAPASVVDALRRHDWKTLFVARREEWQAARLVLLGHALMEKLMQPRKAITGHVWVTEELTDAGLVSSLTPERLRAKSFLALPMLGVPGWCDENADAGFYDDVDVFRPARRGDQAIC
jgi:hypothetical protein